MTKVTLSIAAAAALMVCAATAQSQTVLKFGHTDQLEGGRHAASQLFARKVEELTQGRYKVQIICCSQTGGDPKNIELVTKGELDFTLSATGSFSGLVPSLNLAMMPYLVDSFEQGWKLYDDSKWMKAQFDKAPAKGLRFLATWESGFRNMTTKQPLNSPADAKGMKLRTFPNEMMRWTLEAVGFEVTLMPLPEVYGAIESGKVAGQENPVDTIFSNKFFDVAPNVTMTRHVYSPIPLAMSELTWKKLSPEDQAAVLEAGRTAAKFSRSWVKAVEDKQIAGMTAKGAKINRPDVKPFRDAVKPVYSKARDKFGADVDLLLAEASAVRKAVK